MADTMNTSASVPPQAGLPDIAFTLGGPRQDAANPAAPQPQTLRTAQRPADRATGESPAAPHEPAAPIDAVTPSAPGAPHESTAPHDLASPVAAEDEIRGAALDIALEIAESLLPDAPADWRRLEAVFSVTTVAAVAEVAFLDADDNATRVNATARTMRLVRSLRERTAGLPPGAWWRVLVLLDSSGDLRLDYDYGDEPFPDAHLLPVEAYEADLAAFPRARLPLWFAAYLRHDGRQWRDPQDAVLRPGIDTEVGAAARPVTFPRLDLLWARWAVISAVAVAVGSDWGPRIFAATGWFAGEQGGGSSLRLLPGGRAVLSGGTHDDAALTAAYHDGTPLPNYYAGAPDWLATPVLDQRASVGLLSFCYWWEGRGWYRGESPDPDRIAAAIPGIWSSETVIELGCRLLGEYARRDAIVALVAAAESCAVTRETVFEAFDAADELDTAGAFYQLALAGVTSAEQRQGWEGR